MSVVSKEQDGILCVLDQNKVELSERNISYLLQCEVNRGVFQGSLFDLFLNTENSKMSFRML